MICLIQLDQENLCGVADFGDRVYDFKVEALYYGSPRPSQFHVSLFRDGRNVVNPTRGGLVADAVRKAWVR
jgi:hypothetical protein